MAICASLYADESRISLAHWIILNHDPCQHNRNEFNQPLGDESELGGNRLIKTVESGEVKSFNQQQVSLVDGPVRLFWERISLAY